MKDWLYLWIFDKTLLLVIKLNPCISIKWIILVPTLYFDSLFAGRGQMWGGVSPQIEFPQNLLVCLRLKIQSPAATCVDISWNYEKIPFLILSLNDHLHFVQIFCNSSTAQKLQMMVWGLLLHSTLISELCVQCARCNSQFWVFVFRPLGW